MEKYKKQYFFAKLTAFLIVSGTYNKFPQNHLNSCIIDVVKIKNKNKSSISPVKKSANKFNYFK